MWLRPGLSLKSATAARPDSSVTESVKCVEEEDMVIAKYPPTEDISKRIRQCRISAL